MGRRNIYVAPGREALYDEAARLTGSLSAAIETGLELLVARRGPRAEPLEEIDAPVGSGQQRVVKRFTGRLLDEILLAERSPDRFHGISVYATARDRLAVWRWSDPDFRALRGGVERDEDLDWGERRGEGFDVFQTVEQLADAYHLDGQTVAELERRREAPLIEVLDI